MTRRRRWATTATWTAALAILLAGCAQPPEPEPEPEDVEPVVVETLQEPPEIVYPYTYPLTGIGTEEEILDRPIIALIENHKYARPQSGLIDADIVYEILAEGEITRFAAIFHSEQPEVVGPIRSLRPYYAEIGAGWDALIVHAGYSPAAIKLVKDRKLDHLDQIQYTDSPYFWRSTERYAPHNLYTSVENIRLGQETRKIRTEWEQPQAIPFAASDAKFSSGERADRVRIDYLLGYRVEYEYDAERGTYARHMAGEPHLDKESGDQIEAANVLIIETSHRVLDAEGRRDVNVFGPGEGWMVQQGLAQAIEWKREDGVIRAYRDGEEMPLIPGKTWVQVVSPDLTVTFSDGEAEQD